MSRSLLQTNPTTSNVVEVRITASKLFFTSCHSQDEKASRTAKVSVSNVKRQRENDIEDTHEFKKARHEDHCQWCQLAAFKDFKKYPVIISNDVDDVPLPRDFRFIQKSIYREGVYPAEDAFKLGCECDSSKDCEIMGCTCTENVEKVAGTKVAARRMQYQMPPGIRDCLKDAFLDQRQPIYECNEKCSCGQSCRNRVVEKGRTVPLEIFRTSDGRGFGTLLPISLLLNTNI